MTYTKCTVNNEIKRVSFSKQKQFSENNFLTSVCLFCHYSVVLILDHDKWINFPADKQNKFREFSTRPDLGTSLVSDVAVWINLQQYSR